MIGRNRKREEGIKKGERNREIEKNRKREEGIEKGRKK
jgi:hypothetical protein